MAAARIRWRAPRSTPPQGGPAPAPAGPGRASAERHVLGGDRANPSSILSTCGGDAGERADRCPPFAARSSTTSLPSPAAVWKKKVNAWPVARRERDAAAAIVVCPENGTSASGLK